MTATNVVRWDTGDPNGLDIIAMPLLAEQVTRHRGALDGMDVLYINHAISDALMVARGLRRVGARVTSVLVPYHGGQGPAQLAIRKAFTAVGGSYQLPQPPPSRYAAVMQSAVAAAIGDVAAAAARTGRRWMIVEDGGYAFPALHDDPRLAPHLEHCIGAVEHTTRGRWNYEYAEFDGIPRTARILQRPAVTISGSPLKTAHEAGFVAQALLDECHYLLRRDHQFLRHRTVAVLGYGRVGKALAREMLHLDARVFVVDPAHRDVDDGLTSTGLCEVILAGAMLLFGATGTSSITRQALETFVRHARGEMLYLASASSKTVEFADAITILGHACDDRSAAEDLAGAGATVTAAHDPDLGTRYRITWATGRSKQIVLLGNGYPVIFYPVDTHGAPNRAMDPVMTQLFLAAAGLPAAAPTLTLRVHDVDDLRRLPNLPEPWRVLIDETQMLAAWCAANHIDWPTYSRAIGCRSVTLPPGRRPC